MIKYDDRSTHGQTPPVKIKIKELPGLIDMMFSGYHYHSLLCASGFWLSKWIYAGCQGLF
jgi:hypothetical protein